MRNLLILSLLSLPVKAQMQSFNPVEIVDSGKLFKDAQDIIRQIGLNCATDPKGPAVFIKEFWRIMSGVARVAAESTQLMVYKKDYPNICHVMTQNQINSYKEGKEVKHEKKCSLKNPLGKCLTHIKYKKEKPKPSYYWPLYFIEVTEKGNDPHPKFAERNLLYSANRKIAKLLEKHVDEAGAVELTTLVMGGANALGAFGMKSEGADLGELAKAKAMTPFEKLRIRANKDSDMRSYDVNIWPVALGELMARHFSVCGPVREKQGLRPGGYTWAFKGVPMTCPVSMTNDSYAFWDTGMLDYLDPEAVSAMAAGSNPLTCGVAQGAAALASQGFSDTQAVGDTAKVQEQLNGLNKFMSESLASCSFPILGAAHGVAKQALSLTDSGKWSQAKCTLWGSVAPRMSTGVYETDYSYANTALKFKMLSHDLFSVPRGKEERWSLAYPWEDSKSFLPDGFGDYFSELNNIGQKIGLNLSDNSSVSRSEALYTPGSPSLVDMSSSIKHKTDVASNWTREIAYMTGLTTASLAARQAMASQFKQTSEQTRILREETIWKKKAWCMWGSRKVEVHSEAECFQNRSLFYQHLTYKEVMVKAGTRRVEEPMVREWKNHCSTSNQPIGIGLGHHFSVKRTRCVDSIKKEVRLEKDKVSIPSTDAKSITKRADTQRILENAAAATPWVAAEIARNSLSSMTGYNPIKGDRRIYTIWEKIDCTYPSTKITTKVGPLPETRKYDSCEAAIRFEVYKYIQTKYLRKICDAFGQKAGKPWK